MTTNLKSNSRRRGATVAGLGGLALASVLLLCGAGNVPIENFTPQGTMQADLNAGGHNVTNAATVNATNVAASNLSATSATVGSLAVTNLTVSGALTTTNSFLTPSAIGATVQGYNANTTTLGNSVNGTNTLVQTDGNGLLLDAVLRPGAKLICVSQGRGSDTRTGLSKYSTATPFATLTAAAAAAASGDTIVAEDGGFTDKNITLVSGVNWLFLPGATITINGASNNDTIFKDGGTAATVLIAGFGQTCSITSTAASGSIDGIVLTAGSNLTVLGLNIQVTDTNATGTATALSSSSSTALVNFTGTLQALGGSSGAGYGVSFGSPGGGNVMVNGNVTGNSTGNGCGFVASGTTTGTLTVSQKLTGSSEAVSNSTASIVTCSSLSETLSTSLVNNHLTLLNPVPIVQTLASPSTGFNAAFEWGAQDTVLYITPGATLAAGTVTFPADNSTRLGQRLTIATTQTITSLSVTVTSGTIYGYSTGTLNAGSVSFLKIAANTWAKL